MGRARPGFPARATKTRMRSSPSTATPGDKEASPTSWRWTSGCSEIAWSAIRTRSPGRSRKGGRLPHRRQIGDELRQAASKLTPLDHHVDHAVVQQIFGALEAFGQLLPDSGFDHPLTREANESAGLGKLHVAEHRVGSGDAAGRG